MTKKNNLLDRIDVREPCSESWEEMTGNDEVRFCSHCSKNVFDLSSYTRQRAEKLVRDSNGSLCVRYRKDDRGRVITAPPKFTQIKRHAKIAAGVLATTLSVASMAYTQGSPRPMKHLPNAEKRDEEKNSITGLVLSGVVADPTGAVVPDAELVLVMPTGARRQTRSHGDGSYTFQNVEPGAYELHVISPGFIKAIFQKLDLAADTKLNIILEVGAIVGELIIEGEPLVCEDPPKVSNDIRLQEIQALPPSGKTFTEKPQNTKPAKKTKKKLPK